MYKQKTAKTEKVIQSNKHQESTKTADTTCIP